MQLVMTLLVRNEADIIDDNINFHLDMGVDHIVATDNASQDGTTDILRLYQSKGVLTLIQEPSLDFKLDKWVNRMIHFARDELNAEWIFNNDADEFWMPWRGDLKDVIRGSGDMLFCHRQNMINSYDRIDRGHWKEELVYTSDIQISVPNLRNIYKSRMKYPYFYYNLPPKVLVRSRGLKHVSRGSHNAEFYHERKAEVGSVTIFHYPVRSTDEFFKSIRQIGGAVKRQKDLPEGVSWKYRRWNWMLESNYRFEKILQDALPSSKRLQVDLKNNNVLKDISMSLKLNKRLGD